MTRVGGGEQVGGEQLVSSAPATRWDRWICRAGAARCRNGWPARLGRAMGMPLSARGERDRDRAAGGLPRQRPLRIAYASDFHAGPATHPALLAPPAPRCATRGRICSSWAATSWGPTRGAIDAWRRSSARIPAPLGRFAVLGNHDWWSSPGAS